VLRDAELLKIGDHDACRLPSHVAEEHVALRAHTGAAQHDDVACARCLLEHVQCPGRQIGWHVDPQMDHGGDDRRGAGGPTEKRCGPPERAATASTMGLLTTG